MTFQAVVVAAGSGSRAGVEKPWVALAGVPVLRWSVRALLEAGAGDVVVVVGPHRLTDVATALEGLEGWRAVEGGATRAESVIRGLDAIDAEGAARAATPALIHDEAPPSTACGAAMGLALARVWIAMACSGPRRHRPSGWPRCVRP